MWKTGINDKGLKRIAQIYQQENLGESLDQQIEQDLGKTEEDSLITETTQETGFRVGDETPIGIIRNIIQRNGEDIYFVGGNENGAFAQLMTKRELEREIIREEQKQEKQREVEERQKGEEARNNLQGFTDSMNPRQKGQTEKFLLTTSIRHKGEEYRPKEFIEMLLNQGYTPSTVLGKPVAILPNGVYINLQKTSHAYMVYLWELST